MGFKRKQVPTPGEPPFTASASTQTDDLFKYDDKRVTTRVYTFNAHGGLTYRGTRRKLKRHNAGDDTTKKEKVDEYIDDLMKDDPSPNYEKLPVINETTFDLDYWAAKW